MNSLLGGGAEPGHMKKGSRGLGPDSYTINKLDSKIATNDAAVEKRR